MCVSIGLISGKRPVLGVLYNPFLDQLYSAVKGGGAFLAQGGRSPARLPLAKPRPLPSLSQALLGTLDPAELGRLVRRWTGLTHSVM